MNHSSEPRSHHEHYANHDNKHNVKLHGNLNPLDIQNNIDVPAEYLW